MRAGEWRKVKIGDITAIGYVSNIVQSGFSGYRVELTKVFWLAGGEFQFKKPSPGIFKEEHLEPIGDFWDKHRDRETLIDLALQTGDKKWFEELMGGKQKWHTVEQ